jgi:hypothetical protein
VALHRPEQETTEMGIAQAPTPNVLVWGQVAAAIALGQAGRRIATGC